MSHKPFIHLLTFVQQGHLTGGHLEVHEHGGHSTEGNGHHGDGSAGGGAGTGGRSRHGTGGGGSRAGTGARRRDLGGSSGSKHVRTVGVAHGGARLGQTSAAARRSDSGGGSHSGGRSGAGSGGGSGGRGRGRGGSGSGRARRSRGGSLRGAGAGRGGSRSASAGAGGDHSAGGAGAGAGTVASINVEDNDVGLGARGDSDNTASGAASAGKDILSAHLVDIHGRRINLAGKTVAAATLTLNLDTESGLGVAEGAGGFQVDGVPANLQVRAAVGDSVTTSSVGRPVTDGLSVGTPDTTLFNRDTRSVDVVLSGSLTPVGHAGDGQSSKLLDQGGDQHGLVSRQHSLAESHGLGSLVNGRHSTCTILTVGLVGERLLDLAVLVTVETAVL